MAAATAFAHALSLRGQLLDGDRLALVRNPATRTFAGLGPLLADGTPALRGAGIATRDPAPLAALSTWLGWQWVRAEPMAQHALGVALMAAVAVPILRLVEEASWPRPAAALLALSVTLHPAAWDLTGALGGRPVLLAVLVAVAVARRVRTAGLAATTALALVTALLASACAGSAGLVGLVPALRSPTRRARVAASIAALAGASLGALRFNLPDASAAAIARDAVLAWLPTPWSTPPMFGPSLGLAVHVVAVVACMPLLARSGPRTSIRAGLAASFVVVLLAVLGAIRGAAWRTEDARLEALASHGADATETAAASMRLALRRHRLVDAAPWCAELARRSPDSGRADGCLAALAVTAGAPSTAVRAGLQRWAASYDDRRALRAGALELSGAVPDARFAEAFREATGYALPHRRPGESP